MLVKGGVRNNLGGKSNEQNKQLASLYFVRQLRGIIGHLPDSYRGLVNLPYFCGLLSHDFIHTRHRFSA
jgi:hypothetical protein